MTTKTIRITIIVLLLCYMVYPATKKYNTIYVHKGDTTQLWANNEFFLYRLDKNHVSMYYEPNHDPAFLFDHNISLLVELTNKPWTCVNIPEDSTSTHIDGETKYGLSISIIQGVLTIKSSQKIELIHIYNIQGGLIYSGKNKSIKLNRGIYIYVVDFGATHISGKILIHNHY